MECSHSNKMSCHYSVPTVCAACIHLTFQRDFLNNFNNHYIHRATDKLLGLPLWLIIGWNVNEIVVNASYIEHLFGADEKCCQSGSVVNFFYNDSPWHARPYFCWISAQFFSVFNNVKDIFVLFNVMCYLFGSSWNSQFAFASYVLCTLEQINYLKKIMFWIPLAWLTETCVRTPEDNPDFRTAIFFPAQKHKPWNSVL